MSVGEGGVVDTAGATVVGVVTGTVVGTVVAGTVVAVVVVGGGLVEGVVRGGGVVVGMVVVVVVVVVVVTMIGGPIDPRAVAEPTTTPSEFLSVTVMLTTPADVGVPLRLALFPVVEKLSPATCELDQLKVEAGLPPAAATAAK